MFQFSLNPFQFNGQGLELILAGILGRSGLALSSRLRLPGGGFPGLDLGFLSRFGPGSGLG